MKTTTKILLPAFLIAALGCGDIQKAIDEAKKETEEAKKDEAAKESDVRTGSRTVTKSVTTTVTESGDQSVLDGVEQEEPQIGDKPAASEKPVVVVVNSPILGVWREGCDDGIAYKKAFGADGILRVTTYVHSDQFCEDEHPQVFLQTLRYRLDRELLKVADQPAIEVSVTGDNNTIIIGDTELKKD